MFNPLENALMIDPAISRQLNENFANKELQADILKSNNAQYIAQAIRDKLVDFQNSLSDVEDVGLKAVQFGTAITIFIESVSSLGCSLVVFRGRDNAGNPCELVQHISQVNVLMVTVPKPVEIPHREIGYHLE